MYRTLLPFTIAALLSFLSVDTAGAASAPPVKAPDGMVVTSHHLASEVGASILRDGGNAVDAAVAIGYALAVVNPCCGNIGGGGFATIRMADGTATVIDFRETAPAAATATMFLDAKGDVIPRSSLDGYKAMAVPGTVLGLDTMLRKYGTFSRQRAMAPAIALAAGGFVLDWRDVALLEPYTDAFAAEPNIAAIFLNKGKPWQAGERLAQAQLAATLTAIAADGPPAFYGGPIGEAIVAASNAHGGILSGADLAGYAVVERSPIRCTYRGYEIIAPPPPSSGGIALCEMLAVLEGDPMPALGWHSAAGVQLMVEAMRHAYVDRSFLLGDPAFVANPLNRLLSRDHAAKIRAAIPRGKAGASKDVQPGVPPHEESSETTHFSVVDRDRNAVSVTYTINGSFGARVIAGDTGFFLNDEMDDFTIKPGVANLFGLIQGSRNAIEPGKRPLSSMTPAIVTRDGETVMVLGSPGGARIITTMLQVVMNLIDHGMDLQEAVDAPRIHHQWMPDKVFAEPRALSPDTARLLRDMGYDIELQTPWAAAEAILVVPKSAPAPTAETLPFVPDSAIRWKAEPGMAYGAADNRRTGAAIGVGAATP